MLFDTLFHIAHYLADFSADWIHSTQDSMVSCNDPLYACTDMLVSLQTGHRSV